LGRRANIPAGERVERTRSSQRGTWREHLAGRPYEGEGGWNGGGANVDSDRARGKRRGRPLMTKQDYEELEELEELEEVEELEELE
jgi:hypothetical protein